MYPLQILIMCPRNLDIHDITCTWPPPVKCSCIYVPVLPVPLFTHCAWLVDSIAFLFSSCWRYIAQYTQHKPGITALLDRAYYAVEREGMTFDKGHELESNLWQSKYMLHTTDSCSMSISLRFPFFPNEKIYFTLWLDPGLFQQASPPPLVYPCW